MAEKEAAKRKVRSRSLKRKRGAIRAVIQKMEAKKRAKVMQSYSDKIAEDKNKEAEERSTKAGSKKSSG